jgi:hypothetical protein
MKKIIIISIAAIALLSSSCRKDEYVLQPPLTAIENISAVTSLPQGEVLTLKANVTSLLETTLQWSVDGVAVEGATGDTFEFRSERTGTRTVGLTAENRDGKTADEITITVYGRFRDGVFILNEGNMTTENGSLIFVCPKGVVTDSVYFKTNGSELANVTQDLFIAGGKIYIIAQNDARSGENPAEGRLVVADSETLEKIASYSAEISSLSWPTHVAALGDDLFIRDNYGVSRFNVATNTLTSVSNSSGALKNRMAVAAGKVFVPGNKCVMALAAGSDEVAHRIDMGATVSGVIKASDGNIWVSTTGTPNRITKINSADYSVIAYNEISGASLGAGWGATPGIGAKGDSIYFSNAAFEIYRHVFDASVTSGTAALMVDVKEMVPNAGIVYNNLGVHPVTGEVWFTTIKGYGWDFLINDISVFNFSGASPALKAGYADHTHFPAGIFFTDYYK